MSGLVVVDHEAGALSGATLRALAILRALGEEPVALVPAGCPSEVEAELAALGVARLLLPRRPVPPVDSFAMAGLIDRAATALGGVGLILAPPTIGLRDAIGRLAVRHRAEVLASVIGIRRLDGGCHEVHSIFDGGRRRAETEVCGAVYCLTDPSPCSLDPRPVPRCERIPLPEARHETSVRVDGTAEIASPEHESLESAGIVVAGGRGLGSAEALGRLREWAESSGFTFGSSRAPVESGWVDYHRLIGQTGTTIAPRLYVAFGISGAPQHLSGIMNADRIVAVNIDPRAPITAHADLVLEADALDVLASLEALAMAPVSSVRSREAE